MSRFFETYTIIVHILPRFDRCNFGQRSNRRNRQSIHPIIAALALGAVLAQAPGAVAQTPGPSESRELVIGTKVAPPFAIKAEDGTWHGISIDLWRHIADQIHLRYRFQETTLKGLTDGVAEGSLDAAVAALTVTGPRHRVVDFTQPFYSTGLGIAVASDAGISWLPIIRNVFSLGFFRAAGVLFAISLSVGVILWLIEHRHNEHFGAHRHGLGASVWWSAAAMTQAGGAAGEKVPKTLPGRLLAMMWMHIGDCVCQFHRGANVAAHLKAPARDGEWRGRSAIRTRRRNRQYRDDRISRPRTHRLSGFWRRAGGPVGTAEGSDRCGGI